VAEGAPSGAVTEDATATATLRSIGELAALCGHYCWVERRIFELTGSRASRPAAGGAETGGPGHDDPEVRVVLSEMSARHAQLTAQWHDRLPVRAGVEAGALIVPPPGPVSEVLDLNESAPHLAPVLGGLATQFLPWLRDAYGRQLAGASPVSEAPVRAVLDAGVRVLEDEIRLGGLLVQRLAPGGEGAELVGSFGGLIQRLLGSSGHTFPGARAS
jgi:hypothetical protein